MTFITPLILVLAACSGKPDTIEAQTDGATDGAATEATAEQPKTREEVGAEFASAMNTGVDPCDDFYQYACGGWLDSMELPADKTRYTRSFTSIYDRNEALLHTILEEAAKDPGESENMQKVGAVYGACMDEEAVNAAGTTPLEPLLAEVNAITDLKGLSTAFGRGQMIDVGGPLGASVFADFKDPNLNIMHMGQGGLGLPDRDYYLELDEKGQSLLADYEAHVARMFTMAGIEEATAKADAAKVVAFETALAEVHLPRAELRDPVKNYHRIERAGTKELFTNLDIDAFFVGMGYEGITTISVERPEVYKATDALIGATDLDTMKAYLRWHTIDAATTSLTTEFVQANFDFYSKRLRGQEQIRPRWKRCVSLTQGHMGDVLAQLYVERRFAGDSKAKADEMILDIEHAFEAGLSDLPWMDETTQGRAKEKVATLKNKIGYPEKWRTFEGLATDKTNHFANVLEMRKHTSAYWLDKTGKPVDKDEWFMSASDVNAYYNPLANEMAFPAGILQPPFFSRDFPAAMNYGAIGMVMGHELTHGFDDSGRKFAPDGKMVEWWEPTASEKFEKAAECVEEQYNNFEVQPGLNLNGKLTLGENIADLGGIKQTAMAYKKWVERNGAEPELAGLSGDKVVYVAFAQGWCTLMTEELERERVATDSHSSAKWRVNGPLMNLASFAETFECEVGKPMHPKAEDVCSVW